MSDSVKGTWYPSPRYLLRKMLIERCIRKIDHKGKSLLEIGYGSGDMLCTYHEFGMRVYGYDFSEPAREEATKRIRSKGYEITLYESESEAYDSTYDVLVACEVLEHIEDDEAMLRRWNDSIDPNGYLIMSVPSGMKRWNVSDEMVGHYRRYEKRELIDKLERAGFTCDSAWSYPFPINILFDYLMNREYKKRKENMGKNISMEDGSKQSGINRQSGLLARMLSKPALIYPWHLIQLMFINTELGSGFVVMARKNG